MTVEVDLLVFIDVRCIYMLEFLGAGTSKLFVSVDTLLKESRLVPLNSLDVFWRRTSVVRVHKLEFLFDLVLVECWSRSLDGSKVPLAAIVRLWLLL